MRKNYWVTKIKLESIPCIYIRRVHLYTFLFAASEMSNFLPPHTHVSQPYCHIQLRHRFPKAFFGKCSLLWKQSPRAPGCCLCIALGLLCRLIGVYLSVFPTGLHTHFEGRGIFYLPLFLGA